MSKFTFTLPDGRPFEVKGPPGLTLEQARAAFDQQAKTGSLVGLKPGSVLSAATQAAGGLSTALAAARQTESGITGALGRGVNGAAGAIGSVAAGASVLNNAINTTGASIISGPAVNYTGAISSVTATTPTAVSAISTINNILETTPLTNPISIVDYAKQNNALTSISSLTANDVTGVMAQTKNLVEQPAEQLTADKGLGAYGFDADQLERAGIVKPGTSDLVAAGADLAEVLNSPAVYTGKDGIKQASDLLTNPAIQDQIQQNLMSDGLNGLSSLGVPLDALSPSAIAGLATNAAKSITDTFAALIPSAFRGPAFDAFKSTFDQLMRDSAFARDLVDQTPPGEFKPEIVPPVAENTVKRETVDAASARIIGNEKVPEPRYTPKTVSDQDVARETTELLPLFNQYSDVLTFVQQQFSQLLPEVVQLENSQTITDTQWTAVDEKLQQIRRYYNTRGREAAGDLRETYDAASSRTQEILAEQFRQLTVFFNEIIKTTQDLKNRIAELAKKRQGTA